MNKKNIFLMLNLLLLSTISVFSMSDSDKRAIRKELYLNHANGCINAATLAEDELSLLEVIERDIQIICEHENLLHSKIRFCKSAFKNDLGLGAIFGGFSFGAGYLCMESFGKIQNLIEKDYPSGKTGVWFVDNVAYNLLSSWNYKKFVKENVGDIAQCDPRMKKLSHTVCIMAAATTIFGWLFLGKICKMYDYASGLQKYIQKTKKHIDRDQAIIIRLKEIKREIKQQLRR